MLDYPRLTTLRLPSGCPRWSGGCPAGASHPDFVRKPQNQGRKPVLATISTHAAKEMARRIQISGAELGSEGIGTRIDIHTKSSQAFSYGLGLLLEVMRRCCRRFPHLPWTAVIYFLSGGPVYPEPSARCMLDTCIHPRLSVILSSRRNCTC